jgi:hypothetical protein
MATWLGALWIAAMVGPLPWAGAVAYRKLKAGTLSRRAGYWMTIGFELLYGLAALAYANQGVRGVLGTAAMGAGMLVLFLITGSLLLPIVLHALVDLRAIALAPRQVPEAV